MAKKTTSVTPKGERALAICPALLLMSDGRNGAASRLGEESDVAAVADKVACGSCYQGTSPSMSPNAPTAQALPSEQPLFLHPRYRPRHPQHRDSAYARLPASEPRLHLQRSRRAPEGLQLAPLPRGRSNRPGEGGGGPANMPGRSPACLCFPYRFQPQSSWTHGTGRP